MKFLAVTALLVCAVLQLRAEPVTVGLPFDEVAARLKALGITPEERNLDVRIPKDLVVVYFPLEEKVDLNVTYDKASKTVSGLSVTFYPPHRPMKGLDTTKELLEIDFESKDSYTLKIKKAD